MQHHIRIQPKTMATSYYFQTQKSFSILLPISLTFFLLLLTKANSTESLSFSFNKFVPNQPNLILHGEALVTSTGKLQLTKVDNGGNPISYSLGRALYSSPLHIWDNTTGNVASFVTTFSFIINAPEKAFSADGLAFFLAPLDTLPKTPEGGGGLLGLFPDEKKDKSRKIVAVEFDTFSNDKWDPQGRHIGIDVNSIKSIKTASWGLANGQLATVIISYQASTKMLTASLVHPSRQTSYVVSSVVDLKKVLPEFVSVGFSAATGLSEEYVETHDVLSWSFDSKLPDCSGDALETNVHLSSHAIRDSM